MQKSLLRGAVLLASMLLLTGCATLISGTSQKVTVTATPKATVVVTSLSGMNYYYGTTPATIDLPRGQAYTATITLPGYKPKIITLRRTINPLFFASWIAGLLVGGFIDLADGAMWSLNPSHVQVTLSTAMAEGGTRATAVATVGSGASGRTVRAELTPTG